MFWIWNKTLTHIESCPKLVYDQNVGCVKSAHNTFGILYIYH